MPHLEDDDGDDGHLRTEPRKEPLQLTALTNQVTVHYDGNQTHDLHRSLRRRKQAVLFPGRKRPRSLPDWAEPAFLTCHWPMLSTLMPKGLCRPVQSLKASLRISMMLLMSAHMAARGKAEEKSTT